MILFFKTTTQSIIATQFNHQPTQEEIDKLCWLYGEATYEGNDKLAGLFVGPRREMVTPWSTNAVEITQNMNLDGILRIEEYYPISSKDAEYDTSYSVCTMVWIKIFSPLIISPMPLNMLKT